MTAVLFAFSLYSCKDDKKSDTDTAYSYGQISEINGNDVTLLVAEYDESDEKTEEKDKDDDNSSQNKGNKGNRPQGGFDRENMPEGFDPENMPEGGFNREDMKNPQSSVKGYTLTGEEQKVRIPVGTTVTTALGVETDFDVLKTGDMIKYTTKKASDGNKVITAVWIVE